MSATEAPTRYVTLAYGDAPGVYRHSLMLLVSLIACAPDPYEIVVATDRPDFYVWFGTRVEIAYLDAALLASWRGPDPFSMREKLALLRTAWPDAGSVVLLDADVLARTDLSSFVAQVRGGGLFLHTREFTLSRSRRPGDRRLWRAIQRLPLQGVTIDSEDAMWNSGVIAAPAADRPLVEHALALYDAIGALGVRHVATEQLVESLVFARTGRLRAAEPWFTHYGGNTEGYDAEGYDAEIARRLSDAFIEGLSVKEAADRYRRAPIDLRPEVRQATGRTLRRRLGRR